LFVIPARGEIEIECVATAHEPGSFNCPMAVNWYYQGEYQGQFVTITGTAVAPRAADHAPKSP
jgi:hypothetical protein